MWRGYEGALVEYVLAICAEWTGRGYKDTVADKVQALAAEHPEWTAEPPPWLGREDFHRAHQSNLMRKLPEHYGRIFDVGPELPYVWPV